MKDLPFFKFYPAEFWQGDISAMPIYEQGVFIRFCCIAWNRGGYVEMSALTERKLDNTCSTSVQQVFNNLVEHGIIKKSDKGYYVEFLIEQISEYSQISHKRAEAGKQSARVRNQHMFNTCSTHVQQNPTIKKESKRREELELDNKKDAPASSSTKFIKPSIQEIKSYAESMKYDKFEADRFFDFYEAKGWMVGKNKMKDWKAAVRNWAKGDSSRGFKQNNGLAIGQIHHQEGYEWKQ